MTRRGLQALLVGVIALVATAQAQVGRLDPIRSGPVTFTVTEADLAAAQGCPGCVVVDADPGPGVVFEVRRQNPNRVYEIDVSLDGWTPADGGTLEAQATVTTPDGRTVFLQTDWLEVSAVPTLVFDQRAANVARVRVTVAYRLRLAGTASAGTFATAVTYRVRGTSQTVSHATQVGLPTFLTLRWAGAPASGLATLRFEYANAPMAYVDAVTRGVPLPPTSADFTGLEVSTNHPTGFTVTVWFATLDAPVGAPSLAPRLTIGDLPAEGRTFSATGPTDGFVTLATPADFGLRVDGAEVPGAYRVELRYEAARNP